MGNEGIQKDLVFLNVSKTLLPWYVFFESFVSLSNLIYQISSFFFIDDLI